MTNNNGDTQAIVNMAKDMETVETLLINKGSFVGDMVHISIKDLAKCIRTPSEKPTGDRVAEFNDEVQRALKYVRTVIGGLETEPEHVKKAITDLEIQMKSLKKIDAKMNIFETLEILCKQPLAALPEPMSEGEIDKIIMEAWFNNDDKYPDYMSGGERVRHALKSAGVLLVKDEERVG